MPRKAETPKWWDQEVVQSWIGKFKHKKNYRRRFIHWVNWIGMLPHDQLDKRRQDLKSEDLGVQRFFEQKVVEFGKDMMKQGLKKKTGEQYLVAVRSFFSHHYLPLKFRRGELKLEEIEEVKATHKPKMLIDNIELRAIFSVCNPRDKPLLLILASTGLSPVDVAQLRIESLRLYERDREGNIKGLSEKPVYGIKPREKTGIPQHFVMGEEVLFYLDPVLAERDYPEKGPLLITRKGNPYTERAISERIKHLGIKALGEKGRRDFKTKNLRDYFRNCLLLAEINVEVQDAMMGWQRKGASQRYRISDVVILQAYDKAKEHWSVDHERQKIEKIARMESQVGKLTLAFQEQIDRLISEINVLKDDIAFLKGQSPYDEWEWPTGKKQKRG